MVRRMRRGYVAQERLKKEVMETAFKISRKLGYWDKDVIFRVRGEELTV
jgi:hypothetical protein